MVCEECKKWENQAKANLDTITQQASLIKGLKEAIRVMVRALKEKY